MSGLKTLWVALVIPAVMLAGCRSIPPPTPLADLNPQQAQGHEVFEQRCAQCHYDRQDGPLHGPSLLGIYKKPYLPSGAAANDSRVTATIVNGHGLMPADPDISSQDLDDLLAYLHTL
jgi:mono/diheme cytochrome c family protein